MAIERVRLAADLVEGVAQPLHGRRRGDPLGDDGITLDRAELGLEVSLPVNAFARNPRIEEIRPPSDVDGNVGDERDRLFQPVFADIAPWTHDVGNNGDVKGTVC